MEKIKHYSFLILSFVLGFITATQIYGKKVGAEGLIPNTRLHINEHLFSPHHWMVDPIYAAIIWYFYKRVKKLRWVALFGVFFLLGMSIQGFTYSDWYIIYDQPAISNVLLILTFLLFGLILYLVIKNGLSTDKHNKP